MGVENKGRGRQAFLDAINEGAVFVGKDGLFYAKKSAFPLFEGAFTGPLDSEERRINPDRMQRVIGPGFDKAFSNAQAAVKGPAR